MVASAEGQCGPRHTKLVSWCRWNGGKHRKDGGSRGRWVSGRVRGDNCWGAIRHPSKPCDCAGSHPGVRNSESGTKNWPIRVQLAPEIAARHVADDVSNHSPLATLATTFNNVKQSDSRVISRK